MESQDILSIGIPITRKVHLDNGHSAVTVSYETVFGRRISRTERITNGDVADATEKAHQGLRAQLAILLQMPGAPLQELRGGYNDCE